MANEIIYYDIATDRAFRADQSPAENNNVPNLRYKNVKVIEWQFLASASVDGNGDYDDLDDSLAGLNITASAAVDNDAYHYDDAAVVTPIVAATPITTVKLSGVDEDLLRECGRIKFTNAAAETETICYNGYVADGSNYVFTLANASYVAGAQTPTYSYILADTARILQNPIVKDAAVDCTDMATGKFIITLDCDNIIFQTMIHGSREISNCNLELTVKDVDEDKECLCQRN